MKRLIIWIALTLLLLTFIFAQNALAFDDHWTLYNFNNHYQPAKNEPVSGAYLGAYVLQEISINNDMQVFNEMVGKDHVTYFKYVGYGRPFPQDWVDDVINKGGIPHIAWEPNHGLQQVKDDQYLHNFAKAIRDTKTPVFIRFASEMNGTWAAYSGDPDQYIETWRMVHDILEEIAPNAIMLWSVFTFPEYSIAQYYPGDEYVDWVGVNIYNVLYHNDDIHHKSDGEDPLRLLDYVYDMFSSRKPIHISEYGASNYTTTDNQHHSAFAIAKINRLYTQLPFRYPRVKAITYFNVNNVDALNDVYEERRINNYALTTNSDVLHAYREIILDDHYLNTIQETAETFKETLSFNYRYFLLDGKLYVDQDFFVNNLGLHIETQDSTWITLTDGDRSIPAHIIRQTKPRTFYDQTVTIKGIPLREVAEYFGYQLHLDFTQKSIWVD